jgi:hypothetical protein
LRDALASSVPTSTRLCSSASKSSRFALVALRCVVRANEYTVVQLASDSSRFALVALRDAPGVVRANEYTAVQLSI